MRQQILANAQQSAVERSESTLELVFIWSRILLSTNQPECRKVTIANRSDRQSKVESHMARRTLNRHELRAAAEAAEAMGISSGPDPRKTPRAKTEPSLRPKPAAGPRMRVVWAVCDVGGRTVATFDYPCKSDAEALVAHLKSQGKGTHFVRSLKQPIQPGDA